MFKNLLLVALRNFKRDIWYSLLNLMGLSIGITFSLLLIFYIKDEWSYDRYNEHADHIYRISSYIKELDKPMLKWTSTQVPLGPTLKQDYPEVQEAVRLIGNDRTMYKNGDLHFYEDKTFFADSNVFKVFTFPFIEGNPQTALVEPKSMVLTESVAIKFFGKSYGVVGKTLQNDEGDIYKITGVIKDVPKNSHILFNALISESTLPKDLGNWGNFNIFTYVLLNPHTDGPTFERKLAPMYDKYMASIFKVFNIKINYGVQPVPSIHLHSDLEGEPEELGSMSYIYILGSVAFFMLLIACINYMNLATARSGRRAKEIGIRKVTGSSKSQLIAQFLIESTLMAVFALLLGVVLIAVLLPSFNSLAGKFISWRLLLEPETFLILLGIVVFVGVVGGSYPAFYLSKFNPISTLKGALSKSSSNATLRRVLVVIQFSIAMTMLICTWVVYGQLNYLRKVDTGFNKDQVLCLRADANRDIRSNIQAFKDEARKNAGILSVSSSQATPGQGVSFSLFHVQTDSGYKDKAVFNYDIDENYFGTLGMQMKAGRNFSGLPDTLHGAIVNENMVKYFGWKNAIGQIIKRPGDTSDRHWVVVGVVKDFNQQSLYNPMAPVLLFYRPNSNEMELKLDPKNIPGEISAVERLWKASFPDLPFAYTFLDQDFNSQYAADQKRGKIFTAFSILTIAITCLGLLGLIAFITQQRQKEISIRKIMGATVGEIIPLLARNFVFLVGISCLAAFPVSYYFMQKWLEAFPYRAGLTVVPFLLSALVVLAITLMTVIFHTVKAALANPSKNLRSE